MWEAVGNVTTGFALLAFVVAATTAMIARRLLSRERQLLATPEHDRANTIQAINDAFLVPSLPVDPRSLSADQQYSLLLEQIRHRARRFYFVSALAFAFALGSVALVLLSKQSRVPEPTSSAPAVTQTTATVLPGGELPSCGISASPGEIDHGQTSHLNWSSTNASRVEITPDVGLVNPNGSADVRPASTTTYTITAWNTAGTYARSAVTVTVGQGNPNSNYTPVAGSILASPDTIKRGESTYLKWNSFNATEVTITPDVGSVGLEGSIAVSPLVTTTYTITMKNAHGGFGRGSATVYVEGPG